MRAKRVCAEPGCPALTEGSRCPQHARAADQSRGSKVDRGYGREHQALRKRWASLVDAGKVNCWRCRQLIVPGTAWDLGHLDDRSGYGGPEHAGSCNRSAAGRARHGLAPRRRTT